MVARGIVATVAGVVLLVSGCSGDGRSGADPESAPVFEIKGTITVPSATFVAEGGDAPGFCAVEDGYEDLRTGASVAITDAAGEVVGVGQLVDIDRTPEQCRYSFDVGGVPEGSGTYGIEVGSRGIVKYDRSRLDQSVELPIT